MKLVPNIFVSLEIPGVFMISIIYLTFPLIFSHAATYPAVVIVANKRPRHRNEI